MTTCTTNPARPSTLAGTVLLVCAFSLAINEAAAEGDRPEISPIRYTEDWSSFTPDSKTASPTDRLKRISLGSDQDMYLSIGGQLRAQFEYRNGAEWGAADNPVDGVLFSRIRAHADLHLGSRVRVFGELINALSHDEAGPTPGPTEDRLGVLNLFADFSIPYGEDGSLTLRTGRQQFSFGRDRLVSKRDGTNVPRTFDAFRGIAEQADWRIDGFLSRPAEDNTGVFDDGSDHNVALWGVYATQENTLPSNGAVDAYYFGFRDDLASFDSGAGKELRHTLGLRLFGEAGSWDYDWEGMGQFGSLGDRDIRAYSLATITGYTFKSVTWTPRVGIEAAYSSGDRDAEDGTLATFSPLFPRGDYFSELALLGPSNFFNIRPTVSVSPYENLEFTADVNAFWRASLNDGIYSPPRSLLRSSGESDARFVALNTSLVAEWSIDSNRSLLVGYTRSFAGDFIKDTGSDESIDFVEVEISYAF